MAAPKMSETHRRIVGTNIFRNCDTRQKQMRYLLEHMKEPNFALINGIEVDEGKGLNTAAITFRILNTSGYGGMPRNSSNPPTYGSIANFMASIQDYFPRELRSANEPKRLWSFRSFQDNGQQQFSKETRELLDEMVEWLHGMRNKIEDFLASKYYREGKFNQLEVLKRRFKDEWSERTEQQVDADVKADTDIKIVIDDYEGEQND